MICSYLKSRDGWWVLFTCQTSNLPPVYVSLPGWNSPSPFPVSLPSSSPPLVLEPCLLSQCLDVIIILQATEFTHIFNSLMELLLLISLRPTPREMSKWENIYITKIHSIKEWGGGKRVGVRSWFKYGVMAHINTIHKCIPDQALAYLTYWNTSEKKNRK